MGSQPSPDAYLASRLPESQRRRSPPMTSAEVLHVAESPLAVTSPGQALFTQLFDGEVLQA